MNTARILGGPKSKPLVESSLNLIKTDFRKILWRFYDL